MGVDRDIGFLPEDGSIKVVWLGMWMGKPALGFKAGSETMYVPLKVWKGKLFLWLVRGAVPKSMRIQKPAAGNTCVSTEPKFDRVRYQREYMRDYRASKRAKVLGDDNETVGIKSVPE